MLISFYLIGENVNSHKISAKIQKLNQNSKKEVVWVMKDNSFINLNYLLTIEKNNNDVLNTFHLNSTNNFNLKTEKNILNKQKEISGYEEIKTCNNNENSNINDKQGRITKKIIRRKNKSIIINGGDIDIKNEINIRSDFNKSINIPGNIKSAIPINKVSMHNNIPKQIKSKFPNKIIINPLLNNNFNLSKNTKTENNIKTNITKQNQNNLNLRNVLKNITKENIKISQQTEIKEIKDILNGKNINKSCYSATPKKHSIREKTCSDLNAQIESIKLKNSVLNNSSILNASMNMNDKLNITMNTIDTTDLTQDDNKEYKILSNNNDVSQLNNIYSKKYLSTLNPNDYEYDTFCHAIIKTGLSEVKMSLSKYSENFPAPCGHELCSKLPALEPRVLDFYQNNEKINKIEVKQEATSHLIFPLGIKLCVEQDFHNQNLECEPLINTIYNIKGDLYYIASLTIYRKITIKNYNKIFYINPIDVYNKLKTGNKNNEENKDIINDINNQNQKYNLNNINGNINLNIPNSIDNDEILKFNEYDNIYIPECISLVSRFPFFNQLSTCLKTIINMRRKIVNGDNSQKIENEISNFISHLINQVPVASNKYNILFYTPISIEPIILYNPFLYNFGNFTCQNIFSILSIDNIITIFLLILLEQKIIFVDINHLKLSAITFFFINLIYPLTWVNTYQPLLSLSTIRYIQSITPFIMGGNENLILYAYYKKYIIYNESLDNIDRSNILFVSLTNNLISCDCYNLITNKKGQNKKQILKYLNLPDLPKSIEKKLINHLSEIEKIEDLKTMNEKIKTFFCRIMVFILDDYKDYFMNSVEKLIFNKDNYLMNKKEENKAFYKELLNTQLFTQFIFNENELYKLQKNQKKTIKRKNITYGILHEESYKDNSFFMRNKNKIDELKIMIKQKRKERLKNSIKGAKKIVKNLGLLFSGNNTNTDSENDSDIKKCIKRNRNISTFKKKKQRAKIYNIMLMPYFVEEPNIILLNSEKYDYVQNKLNSIMTIDNQLNQINNYKNKYIFDFNQKFDLKLIKDYKTRYFIGTLNPEENTDNISKLNFNQTFKISSQINGNNKTKSNSRTKNIIQSTDKENAFLKSKEKINTWFVNICLSSNKRKISYDINIIEDLKSERTRKLFAKLISQNYKTLFDIKENNQKFISNEGFIELLQKIQFILSKINYDEFNAGKLLTLSCFKYYTILEERRNSKFYLYNKYNEIFTPCELWMNHIFWKTWFDEDISYFENEIDKSNDEDYSFELNKTNSQENELYEYNEENNNMSIEYRLLVKMSTVMNQLKLEDNFVKKIILDDLAMNYLGESELNLLKEQYS